MVTILTIAIAVAATDYLKALIIGSDFNFYFWFKYGKEYSNWYFNSERTTFRP